MESARQLDAFPLVCTNDVDELRCSLGRVYAKPVLQPVGRSESFRAVANFCQLQHIGLHYASYGADLHFEFPETGFFAQLFPVKGAAEARIDGASVTIDAEHSAIISADCAYKLTSNADYERVNLVIDHRSLTEKLSAIIGDTLPAALEVQPSASLAQPAVRALRQNFMFLVDQMSTPMRLPPLLLAEFEQTLMVMFLQANQHNYSHLLQEGQSSAAFRQVRLAEEYIEANWDKPISSEAIAREVGVGTLSLFQSFRQIRGYSPMEFLKQARLRRVRQRLQRPEDSTTVTDVAFACGFGDLIRFRNDYFLAFGERPSETLNRSKDTDFTRH
jgi:AraC-like DNA-binding protein